MMNESLVLLGEIGGNDVNHPLRDQKSLEEIKPIVPKVVEAISAAVRVSLFLPFGMQVFCAVLKAYVCLNSS